MLCSEPQPSSRGSGCARRRRGGGALGGGGAGERKGGRASKPRVTR